MNVLIVGNGGRENAIKHKLLHEGCTVTIVKSNEDQESILEICKQKSITLVIIGPEAPLVNGLVDFLTENNIPTFGPTKQNSKLEGSKVYSKHIMSDFNIPTSPYFVFITGERLLDFFNSNSVTDWVIKEDGLAGGKGVFLPNTLDELKTCIKDNQIYIVEKRLYGTEVSVLAFCNGKKAYLMPQTKDYKRRYDRDAGPNTGGMGAVCPVNILNKKELMDVQRHLNLVVKEFNYKGILYAGLMKTDTEGIYFLEFNCRFGDPETQVILPLLKTSLKSIFIQCINGKTVHCTWNTRCCGGLVLSHTEYPYKKLDNPTLITISDTLDKDITIYHSSATEQSDGLYTVGGRVMTLTTISRTFKECFKKLYKNAKEISYDGIDYRTDIGNEFIGILNYDNAGVSLSRAGSLNKILKNQFNIETDQFSGVFPVNDNVTLVAGMDGVGSKIELSRMTNNYSTIGIDLVAMCVNDLIVQGAQPLFFLDYIGLHYLDVDTAREILVGIREGCRTSGCALLGGETAEVPSVYSKNKTSLVGCAVGIIKKKLPRSIFYNDYLFGLKSSGIHSNGYSLVLELLKISSYPMEELMTPTKIYVKETNELLETYGNNIKGFSHITGGGLIENVQRVLPKGLTFIINKKWDIPKVFTWISENSDMTTQEMYSTFNMGIGMVVISQVNIPELIPIGVVCRGSEPILKV